MLLSSHLLDQVQRVCDRVALFQAGRIATDGFGAELADQMLGSRLRRLEVEAEGAGIARRLAADPRGPRCRDAGRRPLRMTGRAEMCGPMRPGCRRCDGSLRRLSVDEPSLEAIYAHYFKGTASEECVMRREGSAFAGAGTAFVKELSDNISSVRMLMLELLVVLTALRRCTKRSTAYGRVPPKYPFLLLRLFTLDQAPSPSFVAILGFLIPLTAIGLGFDAINSEHNRTLSRILAQPIYRDAPSLEILAGLATIVDPALAALWSLVIGLGRRPRRFRRRRGDRRSLAFLVVAIFYAGVRPALARLPSATFVRPRPRRWSRFASGRPDRAVADAGARDRASDRARGSARTRNSAWRRRIPRYGRRIWRACRRTICSARPCWRCCRPRPARSVRCFSTNCVARSWARRSHSVKA